jgi:hypothetical protein
MGIHLEQTKLHKIRDFGPLDQDLGQNVPKTGAYRMYTSSCGESILSSFDMTDV